MRDKRSHTGERFCLSSLYVPFTRPFSFRVWWSSWSLVSVTGPATLVNSGGVVRGAVLPLSFKTAAKLLTAFYFSAFKSFPFLPFTDIFGLQAPLKSPRRWIRAPHPPSPGLWGQRPRHKHVIRSLGEVGGASSRLPGNDKQSRTGLAEKLKASSVHGHKKRTGSLAQGLCGSPAVPQGYLGDCAAAAYISQQTVF